MCVFERLEIEKVAILRILFAILYYAKAKRPLFAGKMDEIRAFSQLLARFKAVFNRKWGDMITFSLCLQIIPARMFIIIYITNISSILPKCFFFLKIHNIFYTFQRIYLKNFSLFCNFHHFLSFYSQNTLKIKICIFPFLISGRDI